MVNIVRNLLRSIKKQKEDKKTLTRQERKASKHQCVPIDHPNYHRPDPLTYSQHYLMSLGLGVTWQSPDIVIKKDGVTVLSNTFEHDTDYVIEARIWNNSFDAVVVGMPVVFSYLSFGAGTHSNPIGQTTTNLSVLGGSQNPSFASMLWRTPSLPGHYCIQVNLIWPDDKNPNNNMGQRNVDVGVSRSPADFNFMVENNDNIPHRYHMETDTYTIQPLPDKNKDFPKSQTPQYGLAPI